MNTKASLVEQLQVTTTQQQYPIYIGTDIIHHLTMLADHIRAQQVLVVTNETVAPLYLDKLLAQLNAYQTDTVILPDGEQYKTLSHLNAIFDRLLEQNHHRSTTLLALGGGVVGDMTGFAAASYQRGVNYIQIPTTLLAQVDSSVGGKTAVNHPLGKNMIGAFYQPAAVLADIHTLQTLPPREYSAGIAEVIKYGLIYDAEFFQWLEDNFQAIMQLQEDVLIKMVHRCCEIKAEIVSIDEKEQGLRAILNFGHTFGHAIESGLGYGQWLHGEAIGLGMLIAADVSRQLGWVDQNLISRVYDLLTQAKLPTQAPKGLSLAKLKELLLRDKKALDQGVRFVLLEHLGKAVVTDQVPDDYIDAALMAWGWSKS